MVNSSNHRVELVEAQTSSAAAKRGSPLSRPSGTLSLKGRGEHAERRYVLRPHRPGDMGWVISRHGALYAQEYGWDGTFEALVAEICAKFINEFDPTRERCWIAEDDAGPLGCVFVVKKNAATAKLRMLLVEPRARGMKLGARLVDEAIAFARASGYKKMTLWTNDILHAARHIYVERGFKLVKEEKHHSFGKDLVGQHWDLQLVNR
jgi:GNAT superfamily N-acetyltransferase